MIYRRAVNAYRIALLGYNCVSTGRNSGQRCSEKANVATHREGSEQRASWISGWQKCFLEAAYISSFAPSNFEILSLGFLNRPRNLNLEILSYEPLNFDV